MLSAKAAGASFIRFITPLTLNDGSHSLIADPCSTPGVTASSQKGAGVFVAGRDLNASLDLNSVGLDGEIPVTKFLGSGMHQYLILVPENPTNFENAGKYAPRNLGDGTLGIVLGAHKGEVDGKDTLITIPFEEADMKATEEYYNPDTIKWHTPDFDTVVKPVNLSNGTKSNDQTIQDILESTENYNKNEPIPYGYPTISWLDPDKERVNSNSWVQSIIDHTAGPGKVEEDLGWTDVYSGRRIDSSYFEPPPTIEDTSLKGTKH